MTLRPWRDEDVPALLEATRDDELATWLDRLPRPYTEVDARGYVAFGRRGWRGEEAESPLAIADASDDRPLGSIGIRWDAAEGVAEVGYWVRGDARGRGVATRATRLVAAWVLGDLGFDRLELRADPRNVASCRVAEAAGFTLDGTMRSVRYNRRQERRIDLRVYSLLRDEL